MWRKLAVAVVAAIAVIGGAMYAAFHLSPWPSVLLIRYAFDQGGAQAAAAVAPQVPQAWPHAGASALDPRRIGKIA
jgi:hypothetical protein